MSLENYKSLYSPVQRIVEGKVICVLCLLVMLTGCATSQDLGRMQWEVNALRSEIKKVKKRSQTIETRLPGQEEKLTKGMQGFQETQNATARTVSDLLIQIQSLTTEFQRLTGQFEEAQYVSEKSSNELTEIRESLTAKIKEIELSVADLKTKIETVEATIKADKAKKAESKKNEQNVKKIKDIYLDAYQAFKDGRTGEAREKFQSLLSDYPVNEYTDNARFWIGESYYKDGSYEDAILAYEELFKKHADSDKVPGAMLKQGLAFYALKEKKTGQLILEKLIEKFPDSEQARLAKKKMKKLVVTKSKD